MHTFLFILSFLVQFAQEGNNESVKATTIPSYQPGEKLVYIAHYGLLNAGKASFIISDHPDYRDSIYHAKATAWTIGLADRIFEVKDIYESYFNVETGLPVKAIRNISEGNYRYYNEVEFKHDSLKVLSQKSGRHDIPKNTLDMVSALYSLRSQLQDGVSFKDTLVLTTYFADEIFPLKLKFKGTEQIRTRLGRFECLKLVPLVEPGRIFDSEDDVTIWISNDRNFIPMKVRIDLIIGSVKCDLVEYSGTLYPFHFL